VKEPRARGPVEIEGWGESGEVRMHAKLLAAILCSALLFAAARARADETPPADEKPADTAAKITLPPGFKPKKRGKYTLYCRKETVMGTRFPAERCYDEDGIRQLVLALREERAKIDQMRRICSQQGACGAN
jgi:hypothetical protein